MNNKSESTATESNKMKYPRRSTGEEKVQKNGYREEGATGWKEPPKSRLTDITNPQVGTCV